jgi:hypothetical protein
MKRIVQYSLIFGVLVHSICMFGGFPLELPGAHERLFASLVESRQKQVERLQQERAKLVQSRRESDH